ncbi:uncharacterized protein EI97DRAFT_69223 [Westerdykella ornata]|uniref:4'-phosphopantetheinyl transferase domain-containing protein n=1 Tax=Westerdykella ornata TaxID=318751 RepID=A0A6A6JGJ0_WESOR|nr:uncharacterized protein EI97DRAFT_69223 [Westerdykella ornata]KAF2275671.1 hypothetical protein EI97DRAFT_69223 [Westerdykella ornata]
MPPRPFPYPLRIGTDICHIPRIRALISKKVPGDNDAQPLDRFLSHILTWPERQHFINRFGRVGKALDDADNVAKYLAGRWAAKEACRKACEHLGQARGLHHIMILPAERHIFNSSPKETSRPRGLLLREPLDPFPSDTIRSNSAARRPLLGSQSDSAALSSFPEPNQNSKFDLDSVEGQFFEVSISHDGEYAQAVAMVPVVHWEGGE